MFNLLVKCKHLFHSCKIFFTIFYYWLSGKICIFTHGYSLVCRYSKDNHIGLVVQTNPLIFLPDTNDFLKFADCFLV